MIKVDEIDEDEFNEIVAEKRHKELFNALRAISKVLIEKSDSGVIDAINKQVEKIGNLVKAIQNIPKAEPPEVNVDLNPKEFVLAVKDICKDIIDSNNKVIDAIENRLLPDTFDLIKNYGITQSVKVNYKTAKEIKIKK